MKKYWEIIAENLSKQGWSWGYCSQTDAAGQTTFMVDAHRDAGKCYIVRSNEVDRVFGT